MNDKYGNQLRLGYHVVPDTHIRRGVGEVVAFTNEQVLVRWEDGEEEYWMSQNLIMKDQVHEYRR